MTVTGSHPAQRSRPTAVTAVVVLSLVQAVLLLGLGVLLILGRNQRAVIDDLELSSGGALATGIVLVAFALAEGALAVWLARGGDTARSVFGAVNTVHVATQVYALVALRDVRVASIWSLALPVGVLWLLYGSPASQEYFDS